MPIREYVCTECGHVSELIVGIGRNSDEQICKSCGGTSLEARMSVPAAPVINESPARGVASTCCGGTPSDKGCVPGSCCGSS